MVLLWEGFEIEITEKSVQEGKKGKRIIDQPLMFPFTAWKTGSTGIVGRVLHKINYRHLMIGIGQFQSIIIMVELFNQTYI